MADRAHMVRLPRQSHESFYGTSAKDFKKVDPPNPKDNITDEEIEMFQQFGCVGWKYFSDNLFQSKSQKLESYIKYMNNYHKMQDFLKMLGGERQKIATKKFHALKRMANFETRTLKDVDSMITEMRQVI